VTSSIEHPAVLNACAQLEREGCSITYLPVGGDGIVDPADIRRALRPQTVLIGIMHANNEIGTLQPVAEIAQIAREAGIAFHTDAVQTAGRIPLRVKDSEPIFCRSAAISSARRRAWAPCTCARASI
jgi:cysteine desulfurase